MFDSYLNLLQFIGHLVGLNKALTFVTSVTFSEKRKIFWAEDSIDIGREAVFLTILLHAIYDDMCTMQV